MPQFAVTKTREKILSRIPDYAVEITSVNREVTVSFRGVIVARSARPLLVKETKHADVYYLPRGDVDMSLFTATDLSTYCPFKGYASYWMLDAGGASEDNVVWSYEDPCAEVMALKDAMSFYTDRADLTISTADGAD
jgi:uncharacterized protein (DUF427 family)